VVSQVAVDRRAVLRIVVRLLEQRHADAHYDRAFDLILAGQRVDDASRVDDGDDAAHAQPRDRGLPGDFGEVAAERMRRELRLWIAERRFGFSVAADETQVGALEKIGEG